MPLTNIEIETMTMVKAACRKYTEENNRVAPIDWEQRRYEIAKACFIDSHRHFETKDMHIPAQIAIAAADALIAELKK